MWNIVTAVGIVVTLATAIPVFAQMRNHPRGLHILFFAEMWERFSYYGMRGILVAYMTQHFLFDDTLAQGQYGAYTALVYLLPLIGGFVADKYIGTRKAIAFGALLLVAGHLAMAIEQKPATQTLTYQGQTYEFAAQGRQDQRQTWLVVDGERYEYGPVSGALEVSDLPDGAPLPSFLLRCEQEGPAQGCYQLSEPDTEGAQTLSYDGAAYQVVTEDGEDGPLTSLVIDGERFAYKPSASIEIHGLPADASLPSIVTQCKEGGSGQDCYTLDVVGRNPLFVNIFYLALSLIIMGVGFLKPNISTIVGQLYPQGDPRRDAGFTLYYFGINLGAFWASVLCAGLGATFGWWAGFGLAGIGMALGWVVFVRRRLLFFMPGPAQLPDDVGGPPDEEKVRKPVLGPLNVEQLIYVLGVLGVGVVWLAVQREPIVNATLSVASIAILLYFIYYMVRNCTWVESQRMILALILVAASVIFFTLFELAGSALNQFAERTTQMPSNGFFTITSGQTQAFNAGFILLLAPLYAMMWNWMNKTGRDPGDPAKFALGLIGVGAGFLVLVWGAQYADEAARVPLIFLVLLYLLHTMGELFLSPVGLSAMTKLTPAAVVSTMMATWFLASSIAQALAAQIAKLTAAETVGGQVLDPHAALARYVEVFTSIGWWAVGLGVALGIASPFLKKLAHQQVNEKIHVVPDRPPSESGV